MKKVKSSSRGSLTKAQVAALYGIDPRTLRRWLKREGLYFGLKRILSSKEVCEIILVFGPLDIDFSTVGT